MHVAWRTSGERKKDQINISVFCLVDIHSDICAHAHTLFDMEMLTN